MNDQNGVPKGPEIVSTGSIVIGVKFFNNGQCLTNIELNNIVGLWESAEDIFIGSLQKVHMNAKAQRQAEKPLVEVAKQMPRGMV